MMESKSKMWREGSVDFTEDEDDSESNIKVTWTLPERLDFMTFIGKDVIAIAHDIYITFLNFKNHTELVYTADSEEHGDGVDVIAGHRSTLFAFTEKTKNGRILILNYPSFNILEELKDTEVNRYKGLCMMESDLVAGFSGFPNYLITVWSWRTRHRLLALPTNVIKRNQIYMASRSHMLICECWGDGLIVWEVAQCYKKCLMMKRAKEEKTGWEVSEPPFVGVCWSNDGQLYAVDPQGHIYSVLSDGIGMVTNLEWDDVITGNLKTCICSFGNGLLIYGPDNCLRSLKKCESKWKVAWSYAPRDEVVRLISNFSSDVAAIWTVRGFVYRLLAHPDSDEVDVSLFTYKQRNIQKIQFIAPNFDHIATIDAAGVICVYEIANAKLVLMKFVQGNDISIVASPVDPLLIVFGEVGHNYGMALELFQDENLQRVENYCLTHQIVSQVMFSPSGREFVAAAMSAGHIFIFGLSEDYQLTLVRYTEIGRGLADCFLMKVGEFMRCFSLVLFSDKYLIGERIVCINAESGKDNKFAGKMEGPYSRLVATGARDRVVAIPRPSMHYHVLQLSADKGVSVFVKMAAIINAGHDIKQFDGFYNVGAFLTFGFDGQVIIRKPEAPEDYEVKVVTSHRYESGLRQAISDDRNKWLSHLSRNRTVTLRSLRGRPRDLRHVALPDELLDRSLNLLYIFSETDKNYLDIQEEKKVHEEALDCMKQREEVVRNFEEIRAKLVQLLEENLLEPPLHQLSLAEFDLHLEHKRERMKQAEKEREEIRLKTEARIRAQDKVTAWIKSYCWDKMLTPRVKLFAVFSHYQVENYPVLPTQRDMWPELQLTEAIRTLEMDNNEDVFRPWEEIQEALPGKEQSEEIPTEAAAEGSQTSVMVQDSRTMGQDGMMSEELVKLNPYSLSGTNAHRLVDIPPFMIPQTLAFSFMQMNWLQHIVKLNVQNLRLWFNKQFDDLMNLKKREVGLVEERNARLRFIIEELNKLSDLRGSFHHLMIQIKDPEWRQEEQPQRLIKVEPAECSIEPYISPSQIVIVPPDPGPKDDFRERALIEMMDGVLEKLWHEEIKKPIPKPQCMLDKEPEHFNEDDLRLVFEYEKKVAFRNEERDKYRKMLHAEYAKLSQLLNDGVVKFNQKVKEAWLMKLRVDSVIGQENLNLMRLRRVNLDRVETAERVEAIREQTANLEAEVEMLTEELKMVHEQNEECQTLYDSLAQKDKLMDRTFKNHFADLSQIIVDQCYKYFKRRPKWQARATMTPVVLNELAVGVASGVRPPMLHPDCNDYFKGMEQLDQISNMPAVMDEGLWHTMCKLRRAKTDVEIKMRAIVAESAFVESAGAVWSKALQARRTALQALASELHNLREDTELNARNKTVQLVLPAGQVEILTTGHIEDYEDATLILREDIEKVNEVILKVGDMKLHMMRKQMDFRKGILSKEWEHAQMKMKLRHMEQELYSYKRLKIPKELQMYLKKKETGYNDEMDYVRMEREMAATRASFNRNLQQEIQRVEEIQVKVNAIEDATYRLEKLIVDLNVKVSEKRLKEDPLEPIRIRRIFKKRMETLVARSKLIREVQQNHINIVLLQTELELLRLKTYPTLATFRTLS